MDIQKLQFLSSQEQEALITQAQLLKVAERITRTAEDIKKLFGAKEGQMQSWTGMKIDIPVALDELTPEKFDKAVPDIRKALEEYHELRRSEKKMREELDKFRNFNIFDVKLK